MLGRQWAHGGFLSRRLCSVPVVCRSEKSLSPGPHQDIGQSATYFPDPPLGPGVAGCVVLSGQRAADGARALIQSTL